MKKLNVTRKHFNESKYFTRKYGKLAFVSESGKLFKTDKGKILKFRESKQMNEGLFADIGDTIDSGITGAKKFFHGKPKFKKGDIVMLCLADFSPSEVHHGEEIDDVKWNGKCWEYKMGNDPFGNAQWWPEDRVAEDPEPDKGSEPYVPEKFPEFSKFKKCYRGKSDKEFSEGHAKGEHLYSIVIKDLEGWEASFQVNAMNDEEAEEKARTHMKDGEEILHIYDIGEYKAFDADEYAGFDESGSGKSEWFDDHGELVKPLPGQCIEDCSGSGRVDDQVAYWVDELGFDIDLPRDKAIKFLSEYGAWESDELENMDIIELAEKVLWIFCGNIKEEAYEQSGDETSLVYDWGDVSDWNDEDWKKFQEEYSYCSLNS